jgi:hypothetical protein
LSCTNFQNGSVLKNFKGMKFVFFVQKSQYKVWKHFKHKKISNNTKRFQEKVKEPFHSTFPTLPLPPHVSFKHGARCWYRWSYEVTVPFPLPERKKSGQMKSVFFSIIEYSFDITSSKTNNHIPHAVPSTMIMNMLI